MIPNEKQIEKAFYSDGYRIGMRVADSGKKNDILFEAITEMYNETDGFIELINRLAEKQNIKIDCKKGCEWCCHQPVFALDYELDYLVDFIKNKFSPETRKAIQKKSEEKHNKLRSLNDSDLLKAKFPCPLLENGSCIAYQARPMACRIYLSTDLNSCLNFYHKPKNENSIPALLNLTLRTGQMMNEGFKAALKTKGFNTNEFRIEEKLTLLI